MANYIWKKYNATATTTYKWRQYDLQQTYTVEEKFEGSASDVQDWVLNREGYRSYRIDSNGVFHPVGSLVKVGNKATIYEDFNGTNQITSWTTTYNDKYHDPYGYETRTLTSVPGPKTKGTYRGTVTSTSSTTYPTNGQSGSYWYDSRTSSTSYSRGSYVGEVTAEETAFTNNARHSDGYWYVRQGLANAAPIISGSDLDLGAKVDNFQIEYIVTDNDSGDEVSVEIRVNNNVIQDFTRTSLGIKRFIDIDLDNYDLGKNTVTITARDKAGLTATRVYVFTKTNTAPEISSTDTDLGAKNTPFSITYQIRDREGDSVTVYEKINGDILRTRNNVTLDSDLTITVSAEMLEELEIGKINTIEIEASDGKGGTAYRRYTFKRTNFPPIISGNDTDLGEFSTEFSYTWSATDTENDGMRAAVFFDGVVYQSERDIVDSENYTITFDGLDFLKIRPGKHTIRILVVDAQGGKSERVVSFTRVANRLVMQQAEVYESDLAAQRITVVPNTKITLGANEKIEVTNNGFDENPTWEDATSMINAGKAYNFTNAAKTATKWGVDTRITIELGEDAQPLQSYIMGWGLSYE